MRRHSFMTAVSLVVLSLSCSKGANTPVGPAVTVATITVSPNPDTLTIARTQQFTAIAKDTAGNPVTTTPSWSVTSGRGTITSAGVFTADSAPGTSVVGAASGTVSGSATVVVKAATPPPATLATIVVGPNPATVVASDTMRFTATGRDASGGVVTFTPTWSVTSGSGTITSSGLYKAGTAAGTATIKAASGNVSGTATVTVIAAAPTVTTIVVSPDSETIATSGTLQFSATGKDAAGNTVPITPTWSVTSGAGTINSSGLFTAGASAGTSTVRVAQGNVAATATVAVSSIKLVFVEEPGPTPAGSRILSRLLQPGGCNAADTHSVPITVRAVDEAGHFVPNGVVTVKLGSNPGGGTLSGKLSESGPNPYITSDVVFSNVRISAAGNGYTLIASSPGKASVTSKPFDIVPPTGSPAVRLFFDQVVCTSGDHNNVWHVGTVSWRPIVVTAVDDNWDLHDGLDGEFAGNVVTSFSGPITISVESGGKLGGTLTVNAINGRATFSDLVPQAAGHYVVVATTPGLIAHRWEFDVIGP